MWVCTSGKKHEVFYNRIYKCDDYKIRDDHVCNLKKPSQMSDSRCPLSINEMVCHFLKGEIIWIILEKLMQTLSYIHRSKYTIEKAL